MVRFKSSSIKCASDFAMRHRIVSTEFGLIPEHLMKIWNKQLTDAIDRTQSKYCAKILSHIMAGFKSKSSDNHATWTRWNIHHFSISSEMSIWNMFTLRCWLVRPNEASEDSENIHQSAEEGQTSYWNSDISSRTSVCEQGCLAFSWRRQYFSGL